MSVHIAGGATGGSVNLLHPYMLPSAPATLNPVGVFAAVSDPYLRTMADLRNATKVRMMGEVGDAIIAVTAIRVQYHLGGDPAVASADAGWTELLTSAGSHVLAVPFYTAEISVPSAARVNNLLIRCGIWSGNSLTSPTIQACVLNFYA